MAEEVASNTCKSTSQNQGLIFLPFSKKTLSDMPAGQFNHKRQLKLPLIILCYVVFSCNYSCYEVAYCSLSLNVLNSAGFYAGHFNSERTEITIDYSLLCSFFLKLLLL